jgi:outer membrane protein
MKTLPLFVFLAATIAAGAAPEAPGTPEIPETLSMEQAKAEALQNHPNYAAAQLRSLLAREALKETQSAFYPAASGYVTAVDTAWDNTRIMAGGLNNPSVYDRVAEGVAVTQLITDFGRTNNLARSSKSQVRAAAEGAEASREQVLLNAEANYLATLQAQAVLNVARQTVGARQLLVNQVSALAQNKLKSDLDVSFSRVALEEADLLVQKSEGDLEGAMASLGAALGHRQPRAFTLVDQPQPPVAPPDEATLIETALRQRPDLLNLRYQRDSAKSLATAERDANYPTLAAVGVLGNSPAHDTHLPDNYAAGGVQLSIPLFAGGAYLARQHEAEIRARLADENLRESEDLVVRDVRLALVAVKTAFKRLSTTRQLVQHATEASDLARARYKVGSSSIVELTDAELSAATAAISLANAEYDVRVQMAVLDYQVGALH